MIIGEVNSNREATVALTVVGLAKSERIVCVIDTGFSGYLSLPPTIVAELGLPFFGTAKYELGDGQEVVFSVHTGHVNWDGEPRDIFILSSNGGQLVGMQMLHGHQLHIDVTDGGEVRIESKSL